MVNFNELSVSNDGTKLTIDVAISNLNYYSNSTITEVYVHTDTTFTSSNQSSTGAVWSRKSTSSPTGLRFTLTSGDMGAIDINSTLFFVFVTIDNIPSGTPEPYNNPITLGVVANLYPFYQRSLASMKELQCSCKISKEFIDSILRFKALENYVYTKHYTEAITFWTKYFKNVKALSPINPNCQCYG